MSKNISYNLLIISSIQIFLLIFFKNITFAQTPAFQGAEGAGKYTKGGRGGKVIEVTNLNDKGTGSLRAAIEAKGARIVIFKVSGTIALASGLTIKNDSITIAGQTAPGDGICLKNYQLYVNANEVIIRYIRCRLGDELKQESDAFGGRDRKNVIIDHCSVSWSVDECLSFYNIENLTVQWCLLSESLYMSVHSKGAHGYGGIWGGRNASFHHNLLAHHSSRNPRFAGGETDSCVNVDFRNNVIYNWGFNSAYGGENGKINIVNNYYKAGPATKSGVRYRIIEPSDLLGRWYVDGNYVDGNAAITANNWSGGVQGDFSTRTEIKALSPFPFTAITSQSAQDAYESVLKYAGAILPKRDSLDNRIINEVRTGTATKTGRNYSIIQKLDTTVIRGIIDTQVEAGGWPLLNSSLPPLDTDHDGMPDDWEKANGLNINDPSDRNLLNAEGFTKLEEYLNSVSVLNNIKDSGKNIPDNLRLFQNYPNPFNPHTTIKYSTRNFGFVSLKIYDISGRLVKNLISGNQLPGEYFISWDGNNENMKPSASGIYFCQLAVDNNMQVMKLHLLK
jgi:hypothetical protein